MAELFATIGALIDQVTAKTPKAWGVPSLQEAVDGIADAAKALLVFWSLDINFFDK